MIRFQPERPSFHPCSRHQRSAEKRELPEADQPAPQRHAASLRWPFADRRLPAALAAVRGCAAYGIQHRLEVAGSFPRV